MSLITLDCSENPEQTRRLLCFPWNIPNKYFPWIIVGLFCLLSFSIQVDVILAAVVGFLCACCARGTHAVARLECP